MGRITETHDALVIVTMVTVYVAEQTNVCWWTWESEVNLALMVRLRKCTELTLYPPP